MNHKMLYPKQWQDLEDCLSKPLDNHGKDLILGYIEFICTLDWIISELKKNFFSNTKAQTRKELIAFQNKLQTQVNTQTTYNSLSRPTKLHLLDFQDFLSLMIGKKNNIDQNTIDKKIRKALDKLETEKNEHNPKGAGRSKNDNTGFYCHLFRLWHELGETSLGVQNNDNYTSRLVRFTHVLCQILGDVLNLKYGRVPSALGIPSVKKHNNENDYLKMEKVRKPLAKYRYLAITEIKK